MAMRPPQWAGANSADERSELDQRRRRVDGGDRKAAPWGSVPLEPARAGEGSRSIAPLTENKASSGEDGNPAKLGLSPQVKEGPGLSRYHL